MTLFSSLPLGVLGLGTPELIVIMLIVLLLFGGAKLPKLARGLGQSIKEFKKAQDEKSDDDADEPSASKKKAVAEQSKPSAPKSPSDN